MEFKGCSEAWSPGTRSASVPPVLQVDPEAVCAPSTAGLHLPTHELSYPNLPYRNFPHRISFLSISFKLFDQGSSPVASALPVDIFPVTGSQAHFTVNQSRSYPRYPPLPSADCDTLFKVNGNLSGGTSQHSQSTNTGPPVRPGDRFSVPGSDWSNR